MLGGCGQGQVVVQEGDAPASKLTAVQVTRTEQGYLATEGKDSVLVYHRRPVFRAREHARSHYIHPLYNLGGEVLTEDFPKDHPHQHGIFWAWHQVFSEGRRVGDGWTQEDLSWEVYRLETSENEDGSATIKAFVRWRSSRHGAEDSSAPFIHETTTVRIHPVQESYRLIDFEIALRALTVNVRLGGADNAKGYGGFSLRLPGAIHFRGPDGTVTPRREAVASRPWVDFMGTFAGDGRSGIAILQHPSMPDFPQPWILRESGSMQNAKWPGREPVSIPHASPLMLCYRLVVHRGGASTALLDRLHSVYASTTCASSR